MNIKRSNSANEHFCIKINKEDMTIEGVMAQLSAMFIHLIRIGLFLCYIFTYNHSYRNTILNTTFKLIKLCRIADVSNGTFEITQKIYFA